MKDPYSPIFDNICEEDPRYKRDAYIFVMEALSFTQKKFKRPKHVSGDELLDGMKELLMDKYGPLAISVLEHWGIKSTDDFGNIVFNLINGKVLSKTEEDNLESFRDRYNFETVFKSDYRKRLARKISRMR